VKIDPDKLTDEQKANLARAVGIPGDIVIRNEGDKIIATWTSRFPVGFAQDGSGNLIVAYNPNLPTQPRP
jgi:hypothetical protein